MLIYAGDKILNMKKLSLQGHFDHIYFLKTLKMNVLLQFIFKSLF